MMNIARVYKICVLLLLNMPIVKCEIFTSIENVKALLKTHDNVFITLKQYIDKEEKRLDVLKGYLQTFTIEHEQANKNTQKYVENPINAFTLIQRLSVDFEQLKKVASEPTNYTWDRNFLYPSKEDLTGAAVSIARLQRTYLLNTTDLAVGKLVANYGHDKNIIPEMFSPMTANDCYNLALQLYEKGDYLYAIEWFTESLDKLERMGGNQIYPLTAIEIIERVEKTIDLFEVIIGYEAFITELYTWITKLYNFFNGNDKNVIRSPYYTISDDFRDSDLLMDRYIELCRSTMNISLATTSNLYCSYLKSNTFLSIAPIKMEELHKDPNIYLLHEVLSDNEIEILKEMASPKLRRATTTSHVDGTFIPYSQTDARIGKNAWLHSSNNSIPRVIKPDTVDIVSLRTADFTGLSMTHAEPLQVLNYGIGGHYVMHYDSESNKDQKYLETTGERIATVLFYMSDVSQGGATVFPRLQLAVKPKKGTAIYWMNLCPSGERDGRMLHAACPVLFGDKWVSNSWIHEAGQELKKPCGLVQDSIGQLT